MVKNLYACLKIQNLCFKTLNKDQRQVDLQVQMSQFEKAGAADDEPLAVD